MSASQRRRDAAGVLAVAFFFAGLFFANKHPEAAAFVALCVAAAVVFAIASGRVC